MKSYLMVITAMLIWGSSGVFRRYIPVPSDFLAFLRGVLGSLFMLCLTTTGMVLVSGITETESVDVNQLKGVIFGLSAGLLYALNAIINKRISQINTYHKTFIQLTGAVITLIPYLFIVDGWRPIPTDGLTIISVLILGIVHTGIAFALYFASMKTLSAPSVALCGYIDPISALFLSALVLDETLTVTGVLGAVLIIGIAVVSEIKASTVK